MATALISWGLTLIHFTCSPRALLMRALLVPSTPKDPITAICGQAIDPNRHTSLQLCDGMILMCLVMEATQSVLWVAVGWVNRI